MRHEADEKGPTRQDVIDCLTELGFDLDRVMVVRFAAHGGMEGATPPPGGSSGILLTVRERTADGAIVTTKRVLR